MARERIPLGREGIDRSAERLDVLLGSRASALPPEASGDAFSKIVLYFGDGSNAQFYDVNDTGLAEAISDVTGTDTIAIPPAADGTFTSAITIPANTAVQGTGTQTTFISNTITMSSNSFLRDVTVLISANSGANLTGIAGPSDTGTTGYMNTVSIQITQAGAGDAYGVEMGSGDIFARSCFMKGSSTGGTGNGIKSGAGNIHIEEGSAVQGTGAAISGTNTFSIDSDKFIRLQDITGTYNWIFTADATGMAAAIAAVASGDVIRLPAATISGNYTVASGVEVLGLGENSILSGTITNNGYIRHLNIAGNLVNTGGAARFITVTCSSGKGVELSSGTVIFIGVNTSGTATHGFYITGGRVLHSSTGGDPPANCIGIYANGATVQITNTRALGKPGCQIESVELMQNCNFWGATGYHGLTHTTGTGIVMNCSFFSSGGGGFGVNLAAGGLTFSDCSWNSINGIANVTWGQSDRGSYSVEDYHAQDIEDSQETRHPPATVAQGDMIVADSNPYWTILTVGGAGTILTSDGTDPSWQVPGAASIDFDDLTGDCDLADLADYTQGDLIIGGAADWDDLAVGTNLSVLTNDGTDVAWTDGFLDIATGKTLDVDNSLTFSGTDAKALVLTTGLTVTTNDGTIAFGAAASTLTIPATGTAALLSTANLFTTYQSIADGNELRFYDNGNYVGFEAPALAADQIWILPDEDGDANQFLQTTGGGTLQWAGGAAGDVTTDDAWTALGDLIAGTGDNTAEILNVGYDGEVLYADSGEATGLLWGAAPAAGVHDHADDPGGGQLDWDDIWSDAVHSHQSDAEGSVLTHAAMTDLTLTTALTNQGAAGVLAWADASTLTIPAGGGTAAISGGAYHDGFSDYVAAEHIGDIGAHVYNSGNIAVANTTVVTLTFDSERYDTDTIHSTVANTGRLTATTAGKYIITGQAYWDTNDTDGSRQILIRLNATTVLARKRHDASADRIAQNVTTQWDLSATDYVTLEAYQNSGSSVDILNDGNCSPEFMMQRIG